MYSLEGADFALAIEQLKRENYFGENVVLWHNANVSIETESGRQPIGYEDLIVTHDETNTIVTPPLMELEGALARFRSIEQEKIQRDEKRKQAPDKIRAIPVIGSGDIEESNLWIDEIQTIDECKQVLRVMAEMLITIRSFVIED